MNILTALSYFVLSYAVGSIPWGYLLVRTITGNNVQNVESGRTGGTNTMRAAGFLPGMLTTILDTLKSTGVVWAGLSFFPGQAWVHVVGALLAVLGHNYSIFLVKINQSGKIRFGGGAGGTPTVGGLIGFWWPLALILIPLGALILYFVGYASLATITMPLVGSLILAYRAYRFGTPAAYAAFGLLAEILILWALRPNIQRLIKGTERVVGFRAKKRAEKQPDQ